MIKTRTITALILLTITTIFTGCSKDDSVNPNPNQNSINLEDAKLNNFRLFGITPVSINITQPSIVNNKETVFGKIDIVVPNTVSLNGIASSITSNELNLSKFAILPGNSKLLNYETQSHVHTIVNVLDNSQELLHYTVNIKKEVTPTPSTLTVVDFKFEKSKNPQLPNDVTIERRFNDANSRQVIYLFVPKGTNFSSLVPTATFDAEEVFYTQDSSIPLSDVNTPYPIVPTSFDFAYPKSFIIVLRDNVNNRLKWVDVFVDVKDPVEFANAAITTNITASSSSTFIAGITTWKNVGNHKLNLQSGTTYENLIPNTTSNLITSNMFFIGSSLPNQSDNVSVRVIGNLPVGTYKTTAVFYTKFTGHDAINDLVKPAKMNITANITN
ncbi:hypothetical protein [Flavobacterium polysaccharolyticum]|uniref:DUF4625 domain-containing protein n=1 Tax=Flavobacterium polysaccharolyticum TaxID=3133148 RepID=A0ABU9NKP8_9FLAO